MKLFCLSIEIGERYTVEMDLSALRIKQVINKLKFMILSNDNIIGVGRGNKVVNGKMIDVPTLTFFVKRKLQSNLINKAEIIPKYFSGILTDVLELGSMYYGKSNNISYLKNRGENTQVLSNDNKPALGGGCLLITIDNKHYGATLTYAVTEKKLRKNIYFLASGHFFNSGGKFKRLSTIKYMGNSDDIDTGWVLGVSDKLGDGEKKSSSKEFIIEFDAGLGFVGPNNDKIRELIVPGLLNGKIIVGTEVGKPGDIVYKYGITTKYTEGKILSVDTSIKVENGLGRIELHVGQIVTNQKSLEGDSGSLGVLKKNHKAFGMLNLGGEGKTFYSDINKVLNALNVELLI